MAVKAARRGGTSALRDFLDNEASGGILLMAAAALAMLVANSPLYAAYHDALHAPIGPELTPKLGPMTVHLWINDGRRWSRRRRSRAARLGGVGACGICGLAPGASPCPT